MGWSGHPLWELTSEQIWKRGGSECPGSVCPACLRERRVSVSAEETAKWGESGSWGWRGNEGGHKAHRAAETTSWQATSHSLLCIVSGFSGHSLGYIITYACFRATTAELSSCDRNCAGHKDWNCSRLALCTESAGPRRGNNWRLAGVRGWPLHYSGEGWWLLRAGGKEWLELILFWRQNMQPFQKDWFGVWERTTRGFGLRSWKNGITINGWRQQVTMRSSVLNIFS